MIKELFLATILSTSFSVRTSNDDTKPLDYEFSIKAEDKMGKFTYNLKRDWERELGEKYVDDVFNYREELKELHHSINSEKEIKVVWNTLKSENYLNRLTYHDLYMLYPILNSTVDIDWPRINNITFEYGVVNKKYHEVNGIDFTHNSGNNDALFDMINGVLNNDTIIDWDYNKEITLNSEKILERIKRNIDD